MKRNNHAFTRIELLFCAAAIALLLIPALSVLASNKSDSQRMICFNNLRQIGLAFETWASDHGNANPWRVSQADGGIYNHSLVSLLWYEFGVMSNQLASPKVLVCPADAATTKVADNWTTASGGLLNPAYRNSAVSYIICTHSLPFSGRSLLSADRNIHVTSQNSQCSYTGGTAGNVFALLQAQDSSVRWTNAIHGTAGHMLFGDGSVQFGTSSDLRGVVDQDYRDGKPLHYLPK